MTTAFDDVVARIAAWPDDDARRSWIASQPALAEAATVVRLTEESTRRLRANLQEARRLAEAATQVAEQVSDPVATGRARRASAHVSALSGHYEEALEGYRRALVAFDGDPLETAITRSGALQTLIYLGHYDEAYAWADDARASFALAGDGLRLARLESNIGNVFYRQDRFDEARACYERALAALEERGTPDDTAIVLRNLAVCHISLHAFDRALDTYREARAWSERHGLASLVAKADYNVAYLYYLRGDYLRALELYRVARERCQHSHDRYHEALCDLDQSELSLELNLHEEGAALARRAAQAFRALGMGYERAKAVVNLASADHARGRTVRAVAGFRRARRLFVRERNPVWPALIDLYLALVLERLQPVLARVLAQAARDAFATTPGLAAKRSVADLLLARLDAASGAVDVARSLATRVVEEVVDAGLPATTYQALMTLGRIEEAAGRVIEASAAYGRAQATLEALRAHLGRDDLKVAFLADKQEVFEALVTLALQQPDADVARTFRWTEQAKSRALADQLANLAHALPPPRRLARADADRLQRTREILHSHQLEIARLEGSPELEPARLASQRAALRKAEDDLIALLHTLEGTDAASVTFDTGEVTLTDIGAALGSDGALVAYYVARGALVAFVVVDGRLHVRELGPVATASSALRRLRFQLARGHAWTSPPAVRDVAWRATDAHLQTLHQLLVAPLEDLLYDASELVFVPHDDLHRLPFHAVHDGRRALLDRWPVSYAPSATAFVRCRQRSPSAATTSLVLGVPDRRAPAIAAEAEAVAARLPAATVLLGESARGAALDEASGQRFIHIATHGAFREDNPLFSSIRLADQDLTLLDLYRLRLDAELVTLSGCGTGLHAVVGGEELVGLTRGLLSAGARSVLVTLWDVHDASTTELMEGFYDGLATGRPRAAALREAALALRERRPHPFYWAPYTLVGDPGWVRSPSGG